MRKTTFLCFILLLGWLNLSLAAETIIKIGTPLFIPPFVINAKHYVLEGFDIDFMNTICKKLNWQCQYLPIADNNFYAALDKKEIDFAIGGVVITGQSDPKYLFSLPYLPSKGGFVFLTPNRFTNLKDLVNKRIGAIQGTVYNQLLTTNFPIVVNPRTFLAYGDLILALRSKEIDAGFINDYTALYLAHQFPGIVHALNQHIEVGYGTGIATLASNADKIAQINQVIIDMQNDGTFTKLYNYYFQFFIQ